MVENPKLSTPSPMKRDQIRFLVLEGGGGKGFAYLGALEAMEKIGILKYSEHPSTNLPVLTQPPGGRIEGIGGASAGAITALLLSCGYRPSEIMKFMEITSFDRFFDRAAPRQVPGPFDGNSSQLRGIKAFRCEQKTMSDEDEFKHIKIFLSTLPHLRLLLSRIIKKQPFSILLRDLEGYLAFLWDDMGLFSGCFARAVFADILATRLPRGESGQFQYNATFQDHWNHFRIRLAVTGTNLESGKSQLFSVDRTPEFPVADAVRISMSLPGIYKPYVIRKGTYKGVWVDGGLLNNAPFYEFERLEGENPKTLVLRLEIEKDKEIHNFGDFLLRWFLLGFLGAGEAHINESNISQTILLDTEGLGLIDFNPDPGKRDKAIKRAESATYDYFKSDLPI